jgi:SAM-dependent methyltransferase
MRDERTSYFADRLSEIVVNTFSPSSAVDLGCGVGTTLRSLKRKGCLQILGIEGPWVDLSYLVIKPEEFQHVDFAKPFRIDRTFDVALSLEVAEHLSDQHADTFIDSLCSLSNKVIFSAAIPHQGGTNHLNERWQSYWAAKFINRGYQAFDIIRPTIWNDKLIPFWYRQNCIIYVKAGVAANYLSLAPFEVREIGSLDLVRPELYLLNHARNVDLSNVGYRQVLRQLPKATWAALTRSLKRCIYKEHSRSRR